jgi:hypothetical protein
MASPNSGDCARNQKHNQKVGSNPRWKILVYIHKSTSPENGEWNATSDDKVTTGIMPQNVNTICDRRNGSCCQEAD